MTISVQDGEHPVTGQLAKPLIQARLYEIRQSRIGAILLEAIERHEKTCFVSDGANLAIFSSLGPDNAPRDCQVSFNVGLRPTTVNNVFPKFPGRSPRKIPIGGQATHLMVHELAHGLRFMSGFETRPSSGEKGLWKPVEDFHDIEELFAVIVANIYISETSDHALVGCYPLRDDVPLEDMKLFDKPPFNQYIATFRAQMPSFCQRVGQIPPSVAEFNPFRQGWFMGS